MEAKIEKRSELSKLLGVKNRMSDYLFYLFGRFGIGHLLSRLSLERQDGVCASELILSLYLFRIVGESIHRICKAFSYVLSCSKNLSLGYCIFQLFILYNFIKKIGLLSVSG